MVIPIVVVTSTAPIVFAFSVTSYYSPYNESSYSFMVTLKASKPLESIPKKIAKRSVATAL